LFSKKVSRDGLPFFFEKIKGPSKGILPKGRKVIRKGRQHYPVFFFDPGPDFDFDKWVLQAQPCLSDP
jgi:hypothetical protein